MTTVLDVVVSEVPKPLVLAFQSDVNVYKEHPGYGPTAALVKEVEAMQVSGMIGTELSPTPMAKEVWYSHMGYTDSGP